VVTRRKYKFVQRKRDLATVPAAAGPARRDRLAFGRNGAHADALQRLALRSARGNTSLDLTPDSRWHGGCNGDPDHRPIHRNNAVTVISRGMEMHLDPGGIIAWVVVGLVAGWLAGVVMKGGGFGLIGDIVMGLIGAFVGGIVFSLITGGGTAGFWGSIVVAFIGAVILIAIVRALPGRSPV
jgi:uncharacterized membrane protein YeaQ/YmgE (transglycosylase-associated protein family)